MSDKAPDPDNMRPYFEEQTKEQLVDHCLHLYADCARLRQDLDDATGVIR